MHLGVPRAQRPGGIIEKNGLVLFNRFTLTEQTYPAQGSAEFNGTSDYVQLPTSFSYTNHTIAAWINPADVPLNYYNIFDNRDGSNDGITINYSNSDEIDYRVNNSTLVTSSVISPSQWNFIVMQYDGTTMKIYVNGSLNNSLLASQTVDVTINAKIGQVAYTPALQLKGNLSNVAIWNRALTSDEINSVMWKSYNALSATEKSGLQAWYALDNIDGTSVPDSSGNGNNGTGN